MISGRICARCERRDAKHVRAVVRVREPARAVSRLGKAEQSDRGGGRALGRPRACAASRVDAARERDEEARREREREGAAARSRRLARVIAHPARHGVAARIDRDAARSRHARRGTARVAADGRVASSASFAAAASLARAVDRGVAVAAVPPAARRVAAR